MRTFLFLSCLFFFPPVFAQFSSEKIITACEVCSPTEVFSVDLDGDGDMDVLSDSNTSTYLTWYKNDGIGNFSQPKNIATIFGFAQSIYAADIDGDGDIDILSASNSPGKIAWYENDGIGNFSQPKTISVKAVTIESIYPVDLDQDGDIDVLSASSRDDQVVWYENDGTGSFSQQKVISTNHNRIESVYATDIDGDGDMDVLSASSGDDKIAWYENDGTGSFSQQKIVSTNHNLVIDIYATDIDGDGDIDVLSISNLSIKWYKNDGSGNFSDQKNISNHITGPNTGIYATDIDGDGNMDVLSASSGDDKVAWYKNDGKEQFSEQRIIFNPAASTTSVSTTDIDGDGDMDVLSASFVDDKIAWYANDGNGNFSQQKIISTQANGAESVYAADLDGDGDMDVLSASFVDDKIAWYANDGNGNFSQQKIISTQANGARRVYAADLDGDEDMDVLSASFVDDKIAWYANDGNGNFSQQKIISTQAGKAESVYATDLNGDGDIDVLSASNGDNKIAWYENDGTGSFSKQKIISNQADKAESVYASDLDGDGDMDVLSASNGDNKIAWYENDGIGTFSKQKIISNQAIGASSVYATDLDGDGDMDVLSTSYSIAWYQNDGTGRFSEQKTISMQANLPLGVYAADINGDGDMDVLSVSLFDDKIAWYENLQDFILSIKVFEDKNYNCLQEVTEKGLIRKVQIRALPSQTDQFFFTNEEGILKKLFAASEQDTAIEVRLLDAPNRSNSCPTTFLLKKHEQVEVCLPIQLDQCPTLAIDIGTPLLRRCFDNTYSVSYCNNSREDIENGKIAIQLDSFFTIVHSDLPYEDKGANLYDFIVPTIGSGNCGDFQFTINLSCEATLGQTHCVEAHAFPDTCAIQSFDWSGASLRVAGACEQGEAKFTISNEGNGDMRQHQSLIIVEDATIIKERKIRLGQGTTETILLPAIGATYQAYINQVPNHPGRSAPIAHVEGCGGIRKTGLVNTFPKDDQDLFKAIDCQENIGAYDPNDKAATPVGLEAEHYLASNTDIKYKIRFQNTGTDTAFNIVIWDTLSTHLNAATIEAGASSHPYQFDRFRDSIAGLDRIRFTFSNIMLPDSNINEAASHGFVQFRLQQQLDLPDGTLIENNAAIYFDFNEPIITNVVYHTIGFPLTRLAVSSTSEALPSDRVLITPNPFGDFITVECMTSSTNMPLLSIFDVTGRERTTLLLQNTTQHISTAHYEQGLYFYRIVAESGRVIGHGKIIKQ